MYKEKIKDFIYDISDSIKYLFDKSKEDKIKIRNYTKIVTDVEAIKRAYAKTLSVLSTETIDVIHVYEGIKVFVKNKKENVLFLKHDTKSAYFLNMSDANIMKFKTRFLEKLKLALIK
jgi:hypothetical protein